MSVNKLRSVLFSPYSTTFAGKSLILVSGFVNSILMARLLGPTGRGEVAAATLWPTLLIYLGSFGLAEASLFFAAQNERSTNAVFTSALIFTMVLGTIATGIGYVTLPALLTAQSPSLIELARVSLLLVPFGMVVVHASNILRAQLRIVLYNVLQSIIPVGLVVGALALAMTGRLTVTMAVVLQIGMFVLAAFVAVGVLVVFGLYSRPTLSPNLMRNMLGYGLRVYVGSIFSTANLRLDQVLLATLVSPTELGLYVVAVKIAELPTVMGTVVQVVAVPSIARLSSVDEQVQTLTHIFQRFWQTSIVLKLVFILLSVILIPFLYGNAFYRAVPVAAILIFASIFLDGKQVLNGAVQALNAPWLGSRAEIISAIINALLLVLLLPTTGITGAAIASTAAYGIGFYELTRGLRRRFHFHSSLLTLGPIPIDSV